MDSNSFWRCGPRNTGVFNFFESSCATSDIFALSALSEIFRIGRDFTVSRNEGFAAGFEVAGFDSFGDCFGSLSGVLGVCGSALVDEARNTKTTRVMTFAE